MDITFWVIQALLLAPVLFMAASAGMEDHPRRGGRSRWQASEHLGDEHAEPVAAPRGVVAAVASLSQFTAEQQARLLTLRSFVQQARSGGGALSDDMVAAPERTPRRRRLSRHQLALVVGAMLMALGLVGVVRTSMAMDGVPLANRLLPGVIANPAKYLSAVNGGSGGSGRVDQLSAVARMEQKQAMDRWEALVGVGLSVVLFANALAASATDGEEGSVANDVAPFVLVAAVLFAALSFLELP